MIVNIYDNVILPVLNEHFYDDNYYINSSKTDELPGFFCILYKSYDTKELIDITLFKN
jgi:hypothetical protein